MKGKIKRIEVPKYGYRWKGRIVVSSRGKEYYGDIPGSIIQWLKVGEEVEFKAEGNKIVELYKFYGGDKIKVWPVFERVYKIEKEDPFLEKKLYSYEIRVREAIYEEDFYNIVELEQYHYASDEELVAVWYDFEKKKFVESNVKPSENSTLVEIKSSLPVSRFIILELLNREEWEPKIVGYVRVDPPVPRMHRRIEKDGKEIIIRDIREKVFPPDWFHPTFWPEKILKLYLRKYKAVLKESGKRIAIRELFEKVKRYAVSKCNTAAARIARVVIHPDYRGDGLGMLAVKAAIDWIRERRIPEMRKKKHLVETIAQMARYNPFFERVGFKYLWETKSKRPALYYPLTEEAQKYIEKFLNTDPIAKKHKGRLYVNKYKSAEPLKGKIVLKNVTKYYESVLDLSALEENLQDVLRAFGVVRRVVQKYVLRNVNIEINPGEIVAVIGASGAGKTTLLRMIIGAIKKIDKKEYKPDSGEVIVPENAKLSAMLPGEMEPKFGEETLLEHMYNKLGDVVAAIEVLNYSGLSDAVFYRARFRELSTGQKERAKIASLLAERPNIIIIDEFLAHLDPLTARRVTRKIVKIARENKITLIVATNRKEILDILNPDKILYVGYGGVKVITT